MGGPSEGLLFCRSVEVYRSEEGGGRFRREWLGKVVTLGCVAAHLTEVHGLLGGFYAGGGYGEPEGMTERDYRW
jgi:hypothetical protein